MGIGPKLVEQQHLEARNETGKNKASSYVLKPFTFRMPSVLRDP